MLPKAARVDPFASAIAIKNSLEWKRVIVPPISGFNISIMVARVMIKRMTEKDFKKGRLNPLNTAGMKSRINFHGGFNLSLSFIARE